MVLAACDEPLTFAEEVAAFLLLLLGHPGKAACEDYGMLGVFVLFVLVLFLGLGA